MYVGFCCFFCVLTRGNNKIIHAGGEIACAHRHIRSPCEAGLQIYIHTVTSQPIVPVEMYMIKPAFDIQV